MPSQTPVVTVTGKAFFDVRCRSFSKRSKIKPEKPSSGLCCIGYSPGDETNSPVRVYDEAGNVIETHEHAGEF
jgi:hypothetical protein